MRSIYDCYTVDHSVRCRHIVYRMTKPLRQVGLATFLFSFLHFRWNVLLFTRHSQVAIVVVVIYSGISHDSNFIWIRNVFCILFCVACRVSFSIVFRIILRAKWHQSQQTHTTRSNEFGVDNTKLHRAALRMTRIFAVDTMRKHSQSQFDRKINRNEWIRGVVWDDGRHRKTK